MIKLPSTKISLIVVLLFAIDVNGQTAFTLANTRYIDSAEIVMKQSWCSGVLAYPKSYSEKNIKDDKEIVEVLNDFLVPNQMDRFNPVIPTLKKGKISKTESRNGLIRVIEITLQGKYIYATIKLDYIDTIIIRKNCSLSFATNGTCSDIGYSVLDIQLLRQAFLNKFNFSFILLYNKELLIRYFFEDNIRLASDVYKGYKFHYSDSGVGEWVNRIYTNQFNSDSSCCYSYEKANTDFVALIKSNKIEVIKDLLYSPNYYYSINAMEALLYLESVGKIDLDKVLSNKLNEIMQQDFKIIFGRSDDVFVTVRGYKELNLTNSQVIQKYEFSMR